MVHFLTNTHLVMWMVTSFSTAKLPNQSLGIRTLAKLRESGQIVDLNAGASSNLAVQYTVGDTSVAELAVTNGSLKAWWKWMKQMVLMPQIRPLLEVQDPLKIPLVVNGIEQIWQCSKFGWGQRLCPHLQLQWHWWKYPPYNCPVV